MDSMAHIEAAQREGKTLSSYARERGLSARSLYKARQRMRRLAAQAKNAQMQVPPESVSPFVEVKVSSTPAAPAPRARLWAHLPNGVNVELLCTSADVDLLMAMMDSLGRTPCSASMKL
jgi:transposase